MVPYPLGKVFPNLLLHAYLSRKFHRCNGLDSVPIPLATMGLSKANTSTIPGSIGLGHRTMEGKACD